MGNHIYLAIPIMAVLSIFHSSILSRFPILGVEPQLLFLVALVWGMVRGIEEGLVWAFIAGIFNDLFSLAPMGISSLAFMAGVGVPLFLRPILPPRRLLVAMFMAGLGTLIYLTVYAIVLRVFGFGVSAKGLLELMPIIAIHAVLVLPILLIVESLLKTLRPRRVEF